MSKHIWYDEIVAYANGKTIQAKSLWDEEAAWVDEDCPDFGASEWVFRIKESEPDWWENIPEHGVLCWVGDNPAYVETAKIINIIKMREVNQFISIRGARWAYAIPLTNEEIEAFKR
jgi:hypothetical protein